jgi:hypothetical protein
MCVRARQRYPGIVSTGRRLLPQPPAAKRFDGVARCLRHSGTLIFSLFIIFCSPNRDSPNAAAALV